MAEREARALIYVEALEVPTPRLLTVDPAGADAGVPALLMTALPVKVDWWPTDIERWLAGLADVMPKIHRAPLLPAGLLPPYAPYCQSSDQPPA